MEKNTMSQKPRPFSSSFFDLKELTTSILQGIMITVGLLIIYQYAIQNGANEDTTRTMVFTGLVTANVLLTLVNRSFYYSIFTTMKYKNNLVVFIVGITIFVTGLLLFVPPITSFFQFEHLTISQLAISIGIGFVSVFWYELVKLYKRIT
jgi:Ca2+-transporting ATPase